MKRLTAILLVCGMLCVSLTGCGRASEGMGQESTSATIESDVNDVLAIKADNSLTAGAGNAQNLSEDYVYDYQVSMEPIPKEIADLGDPCQGTIHAFPTKIRRGLTQKMMEEDPELKAEVEKRIPEVEQALADNIGGEFRVDEVIVENAFDWYWFCTEISTGYEFSLRYRNTEYFWAMETGYAITSNNKLLIEDYYEKKNTEDWKEIYSQLIQNSFKDCLNSILVENDASHIILHIIQFTDSDVDKSEEQVKLLRLWNDIKNYNNNCSYTIDMRYFPIAYKEVIEQKFYYGDFYDRNIACDEMLLVNGELIARLIYDEGTEEENEKILDSLLEEYESQKYNMDFIWNYWR